MVPKTRRHLHISCMTCAVRIYIDHQSKGVLCRSKSVIFSRLYFLLLSDCVPLYIHVHAVCS